jgi:hypothetical protein
MFLFFIQLRRLSLPTETVLYRIEPDGSCTAYGIEVWDGQALPDPPGNPFHHRYIDGVWVPIPVEELPVPVAPLEQQVADLQAQLAEVLARLDELK